MLSSYLNSVYATPNINAAIKHLTLNSKILANISSPCADY